MEIFLISQTWGFNHEIAGIQPMNRMEMKWYRYYVFLYVGYTKREPQKKQSDMWKIMNSRILGFCPFTNPKDVFKSVAASNKRGGWIKPCFLFPLSESCPSNWKNLSAWVPDVHPVVRWRLGLGSSSFVGSLQVRWFPLDTEVSINGASPQWMI